MLEVFKKVQYVELPVAGVSGGNSQTQINFLTNNFLQDKRITSIETFTSTDIPEAQSGNPLITGANMSHAFLNLYYYDVFKENGQWVQNIPLCSFHRVDNGTDPYVRDLFLFDRVTIAWEKSFVFLTSPIGNTDPVSFYFAVGYDDSKENYQNAFQAIPPAPPVAMPVYIVDHKDKNRLWL